MSNSDDIDNLLTAAINPIEYLAKHGATFTRCRAGEKRPIDKGWQNKPHAAEVATRHLASGGAVGLLTGEKSSGLHLIDIDYDLEVFVGEFSKFGGYPSIRRSNAPHKAKFIVRINGTIKNQKWKHPVSGGNTFELLGTGSHGLIVGEHESGAQYELFGGGDIPTIDAEMIPLMAERFIQALAPTNQPTTPTPQPTNPNPNPQLDLDGRRAAAMLDSLIHNVAHAPQGARHTTLRDNAVTIGGYMAGGFITHPHNEIEGLLLSAAETNGQLREDGKKAILQTINDGLTYGKTLPLNTPPDRPRPNQQNHSTNETLATLEALIGQAERVTGDDNEKADQSAEVAKCARHLSDDDWFKLRRRLLKSCGARELDAVRKQSTKAWLQVKKEREVAERGFNADEPKTDDVVKALEKLGYQFRMNELDDSVEFASGERLTDAVLDVIICKMHDVGFRNIGLIEKVIVFTAYQNRYHPIKSYLEKLEWDGGNHVGALLDCITFSADTRDIARMFVRKWLIGAVAKVYQQAQTFMLVMDGGQGVGKSHLVRWLCPLPDYFSEANINPNDKDSRIELARTWLWEVPELQATFRKADREALKATITRKWVNERKAYGRNSIRKPVLASFIGTINETGSGFMSDPTGNRRFAVINIQAMDWSYTEINLDQLWAQCVCEYKQAAEQDVELWRLDANETKRQQQINEDYESGSMVEDLLGSHATITRGATDHYLKVGEIAVRLSTYGLPIGNGKLVEMQIAEALKKWGCTKGRPTINGQKTTVWYGVSLLSRHDGGDDSD